MSMQLSSVMGNNNLKASVALFSLGSAMTLGRVARRFKGTVGTAVATPPVAKIKGKSVPFGAWLDENRGENPMSPPKMVYDPYFWLRDDERKDPEVIGYLKEENAYCAAMTSHLTPLKEKIYKDFLSNIKETDESVPYPNGPYLYYSRTVEGSSYRIYCRKKKNSEVEEVLLDMNLIASGKKHCVLGEFAISPDHKVLAYSLDENGYETFNAYFKDLETGKLLNEKLPEMTGSITWGKDNATVFYSTHDDAHRPYKLYRHEMGTDSSQDKLLYTEDDEMWWLGFGKTLSGRYLLCEVGTSESSEIRMLDLTKGKDASLEVIQAREDKLMYELDHCGDRFYIVTNADDAKNRKLMWTTVDKPQRENWKDILPYDEKVTFNHTLCFQNHVVVKGREHGFSCLWILDPATNKMEKLSGFPEPVSSVSLSINREFDSKVVRINYESLVTPMTTFDVDLKTRALKEIHVKEVPNYDKSQYVSKQLFATGHDGVKIPMSIVFKKGTGIDSEKPSPVPLFLDGYGSYGICNEPDFTSNYIALLDRGVAVVHTHIRGGAEMGQTWYEDHGKYLTKQNTFKDFVSCAEFLIKENYTSPEKMAIHGRSAGGLLMGAVLNMAPHLFKCAVAAVPFVDIMNTMSDASIPLTCTEWAEWGNPNETKYFSYMQEYCPYSNVTAQKYPAMLVLAGLFDPRVAYWEPAKWVARLRERKTDDNLLLLKTDLESGHFSASDRYKYLREKAFEYAFVLDQLGISK